MSVLLEQLAKNGSVTLEGYGHQVGGHHLLMKFKDTICKPLLSREHFFYETMTPQLRGFTPIYYGVIKVSFVRKPSGEIQLVASPKTSSEISPLMLERINFDGVSQNVSIAAGESYVNPWSAECTKNTREKLQEFGDQLDTIHQDYIVLENLTSKFQSPSILDIKVGTRQYGDDVPDWKKVKHIQTCANSTSCSMGVRFCGMQKYDASNNEYIFRDKYYGRALLPDEFREELKDFLHNGVHFRADIIPRLIDMLHQLKDTIASQESYRFYSSSLLIIYDGRGNPGDQPVTPLSAPTATPTPVNGIIGTQSVVGTEQSRDSPNTFVKLEPPAVSGPFKPDDKNHVNVMHVDCKALYRKFTESSPPKKTLKPNSPRSEGSHDATDSSTTELNCESVEAEEASDGLLRSLHTSEQGQETLSDKDTRQIPPHVNGLKHHHHGNHPGKYSYDLTSSRSLVDIRMIDFAHATHRGYQDPVEYTSVDDGYILGLNTLIEIFQSML